MSYDLSASGLNLRTLTPKEYGQLIEDLNYNFVQILNLPGFKGRPGDSITGPTGIGIRGSKWIFVKLSDMTAQYGVIVSSQVTLSFINTVFADNPATFYESLYIPNDDELLIGDILVLPTGQLIELAEVVVDDITTVEFIDTGITFAQVTSITEDSVIQIFNQLFSEANSGDGAFRTFNAVAKNNTDASPALNQNQNNDSVIDVVVPGAGPGAALNTRKFIGVDESIIDQNTMMCLISGSVSRYHQLIQATQDIHTNNYAPGIDDFAANVVLQNSYKNGIIFGHKDSETIRQFGRLYRSVNATVLTSSYSPNESEFSDIKLLDTKVIIRSINATIDAPTFDILGSVYNSKFFSWSGTTAHLANTTNAILRIYASAGTYLEYLKNSKILSTDVNGKLVKLYDIMTSMPTTPTNSQVLTALAINGLFDTINSTLTDHNDRLEVLENADTSSFFAKKGYISVQTNLNTLTDFGTYVIKSGTTLTNFVPTIVSPINSDIIVNVYKVATGSNSDIGVQEIIWNNLGSGQFTKTQRWVRYFTIYYGSIQEWSIWSKIVATGDELTGDGTIIITGSWAQGNLKATHKTSSAVSTNNVISSNNFIKNIQLDAFGHISGITTAEVAIPVDTFGFTSTRGWQKFQSGLIIQFGYTTQSTVTFPITFPIKCMSVQCASIRSNSGSRGFNHVWDVTNSSFKAIIDSSTAYWVAFGR